MSRQVALAFVFVVLFLTFQSDWTAPEELRRLSKEQRLEAHRDTVKEKVLSFWLFLLVLALSDCV